MGTPYFTRDKEVYSDTICWLSVGHRLLELVWIEHGCTVNDNGYCVALNILCEVSPP
jgi:hypothetical protein